MIAVRTTIASASCYCHANGGRLIYDISVGCENDEEEGDDNDDAGGGDDDDDHDGFGWR